MRRDAIMIPRDQLTDMTPHQDIQIDNGFEYVQKPRIVRKAPQQPKELTEDFQNAIWAALASAVGPKICDRYGCRACAALWVQAAFRDRDCTTRRPTLS